MTKVRGEVHTEDSVKGSENTKVPYMRGIFTVIDIISHLTLGTDWAIFRFKPQIFSSNNLYKHICYSTEWYGYLNLTGNIFEVGGTLVCSEGAHSVCGQILVEPFLLLLVVSFICGWMLDWRSYCYVIIYTLKTSLWIIGGLSKHLNI